MAAPIVDTKVRAVPRIFQTREEAFAYKQVNPNEKVGYMPEAPVINDLVNSPPHYTRGGIETIDFIEAKQLNYNRGNAIKYITRAGYKYDPSKITADGPPTETIQDLEKAVWYLQREIKTLMGK